jgi:ubiquinone/menaquinone biosynthesis C-methylase UbiE
MPEPLPMFWAGFLIDVEDVFNPCLWLRSTMNNETSEKNDLFWEPISERRWGKYISSHEEAAIRLAHRLAKEPDQALEIGAEGGRWSKLLADFGWKMTCTDIDPTALSVCQRRIPSANCILVDPESRTFPCSSKSQRLLLAIEVHELVEQDWFLEEAHRVLQPGGLMVVVFQNRCSWRILRNFFPFRDQSFRQYTAAYVPWRRKLKGYGFKFHSQRGICWMPFGRMSDSRLIPAAVSLEKSLGLQRLVSVSPWVVCVCEKSGVA